MKKIKKKRQDRISAGREFDAVQFFYSKKSKIIKLAIFSIVIIVGITSAFLWFRYREIEACFLLSQAETSGNYEEIVSRYAFTKTKPLAVISWARKLFEEKKYKEAISVYRDFINQYKGHNLTVFAYMGLAYSYEETGNTKDAEDMFVKIKEEFPGTIWADEAEEGYKRIAKS